MSAANAAVYMANAFSSLNVSRLRSCPVPGTKIALRRAVSGFAIDTAPWPNSSSRPK